MEARLVRRPAASCLSQSSSNGLLNTLLRTSNTSTPLSITRRHKSSTSRTKRALNIAPHPSFLPTPELAGNHIIFNPPSSEPSVFHTPLKFLPKNDPRRRANLSSLFSAEASSNTSASANANGSGNGEGNGKIALPPAVKMSEMTPTRYTVKEADVAEMRRLRAEDPVRYSVAALAKQFNCTKLFVMMCCQAGREHKDMRRKEAEAVRERWGPRRAAAKEERARRLEMLFGGEL